MVPTGADLEVSKGEGIFSLEVKPRLNYTHKCSRKFVTCLEEVFALKLGGGGGGGGGCALYSIPLDPPLTKGAQTLLTVLIIPLTICSVRNY